LESRTTITEGISALFHYIKNAIGWEGEVDEFDGSQPLSGSATSGKGEKI